MIVRYENSLEDIVAFNRYHCAHSPSVKQTKFTCMILVSALAIFGSLFIPPTDNVSRPVIIAGAIVFAGLFSALFNYRFAAATDRQVRRFYKEGNNKGIIGQHELAIDNDGLVARTEVGESRVFWHGVERFAETDTHAFLYISSIMAHVIPRQSVTDGDLDAFLVRAKQLWHERNADAASKPKA